jgi:hypothetical protein
VRTIVLVGIGGLFGADWENRRVERYVHPHTAGTTAASSTCSSTIRTVPRTDRTYRTSAEMSGSRINREPATSVCSGGVSVERQRLR